MAECRNCGAELPENARFCMQCGAPLGPVEPAESPAEPLEEQPAGFRRPPEPPPPLDFFLPAVMGGAIIGILSSLPLISIGNLCCLWVLGGSGFAAYQVWKQRPGGVTYGDGALAGVSSGVFGAIVATLMSIPIKLLSSQFLQAPDAEVEEMLRSFGFEGEMLQTAMRAISSEISTVTVLFTFLGNLLIFSIFATIGGIVTIALLQRRKP